MESMESQEKPQMMPKYDLITKNSMIPTLEPLTQKKYKEMQPHDQRMLQVTLGVVDVPLEDNIYMEHGSRIILYYKYLQVSSSSEEFKKKFKVVNSWSSEILNVRNRLGH